MNNLSIERLMGESDIAYTMCFKYMELGSQRSLRKLAEEVGKSPAYVRQLERWSSKFDWVKRAKDYDELIAKNRLKERIEVQRKIQAELLTMGVSAAVTLCEIATMPTIGSRNDISNTNLNSKLKAALEILDRIGIVAYTEPIQSEPEQTKRHSPIEWIESQLEDNALLDINEIDKGE